MVFPKLRSRELPVTVICSTPALMYMLDPRRPIASSSSAAVLLWVPSFIKSAINDATPAFKSGSRVWPPLMES